MSILDSKLSRRTVLLAGASAATIAATGAGLMAAGESASPDGRYAVSISPATGRPVSSRIFGGDIEPIGRVIYGGVWDRERNIPRTDVKAAIAALGTTAIRWPGSSSSSAYHWRDGIGPRDQRPVYETTFWNAYGEKLLDVAGITAPAERAKLLRQIDTGEPNQFGTNEFLQYCLDLRIDPVLAVNVGGSKSRSTGTPEEAAAWVRHCNVDRKTARPVRWWQLGNEVWSKQDLDHQPPRDYGRRVLELAAAMRGEDPLIKLICVATGVYPSDFTTDVASAFPDLETWNREVFTITAGQVDAASFTWYFPGSIGRFLRDTEADGLLMATASDAFGAGLDRVIADLDSIGGAAGKIPLYLGEWGRQVKIPEVVFGDNHRLYDGVYFAGCFNRMIERSPRVLGAHLSTLVNQSAPIQTVGERYFVTAGYLVNQLYRWSCRSNHATVSVKTDTLVVPALQDAQKAGYLVKMARSERRAAILDAAATVDTSGTTLYLTNRSMTETITVELSGLTPTDANATFRYVTADTPYSCNTLDAPDTVRIAEMPLTVKGGRAKLSIPACTAGAVISGALEGALLAT